RDKFAKTDKDKNQEQGKSIDDRNTVAVNYYDFIIDYLNKDYISLVGQLTGASFSNDPESKEADDIIEADDYAHIEDDKEIETAVLLLKKELENVDYNNLVLFIEKVLIEQNGLSCKQKFLIYDHVYRYKPNYHELCFNATQEVKSEMAVDLKKFLDANKIGNVNDSNDPSEIFNIACENLKSSDKTITYRIGSKLVFNYISELFNYLLYEMINNECIIKKCLNCSTYFIPTRSDAVYCNNISPQNKTKTCVDYMSYKHYLEKTKTDEATRLYKLVYNIKRGKYERSRGKNFKTDLDKFIKEAKKRKEDVKKGIMSIKDYLDWLKEQHTSKHVGKIEFKKEGKNNGIS
ncbi:MAG TPA: DUF6076 domain-containing protein, partial [Oscillospiraceae bacterium]|nr:DUF6076 domain-containing protein [Oscillospiraceae bacterium]